MSSEERSECSTGFSLTEIFERTRSKVDAMAVDAGGDDTPVDQDTQRDLRQAMSSASSETRRVTGLDAMTDTMGNTHTGADVSKAEKMGVTDDGCDDAEDLPGPMAADELIKRFKLMVLGVTNGPVPSGVTEIVSEISLGALKAISKAVASFNLAHNADVHRCCSLLDDQEGRAFLAADLRGVELLRVEARGVGEQIDDKLRGFKADDMRLRGAARTARSKARRKPDTADERIAAIDAKLVADRAALRATAASLELPDAPISTTRAKPKVELTEEQVLVAEREFWRQELEERRKALVEIEADLLDGEKAVQRFAVPAFEFPERTHSKDPEDPLEYWDARDEALRAHRALLCARWKVEIEVSLMRLDRSEVASNVKAAEVELRSAGDELKAFRARRRAAAALEAEREAAREADRIRRHRELMAFYDTLSPDEMRRHLRIRAQLNREQRDGPLQQPLAAGPPRVYDLRGDPSQWQLPSPPPSPPDNQPGPSQPPPTTPPQPIALPDPHVTQTLGGDTPASPDIPVTCNPTMPTSRGQRASPND